MKKKKNYKSYTKKLNLFIEIFIHLLLPYPHVDWKYHPYPDVNDNNISLNPKLIIYFNINMLFFFFCSLRFYVLVKVLRYYNLFTHKRSKNILKFFEKKSLGTNFLYRANLKLNGFITIGLIGSITLIYSSMILNIFEYTNDNVNNDFFYFWNCSWYIIVTMCTSNLLFYF